MVYQLFRLFLNELEKFVLVVSQFFGFHRALIAELGFKVEDVLSPVEMTSSSI